MRRRAFLRMAAAAAAERVRGLAQRRDATDAVTLDAAARAYRVQPGGSIQAALEAAAKDPANKIVYVHPGTYRPGGPGQNRPTRSSAPRRGPIARRRTGRR